MSFSRRFVVSFIWSCERFLRTERELRAKTHDCDGILPLSVNLAALLVFDSLTFLNAFVARFGTCDELESSYNQCLFCRMHEVSSVAHNMCRNTSIYQPVNGIGHPKRTEVVCHRTCLSFRDPHPNLHWWECSRRKIPDAQQLHAKPYSPW